MKNRKETLPKVVETSDTVLQIWVVLNVVARQCLGKLGDKYIAAGCDLPGLSSTVLVSVTKDWGVFKNDPIWCWRRLLINHLKSRETSLVLASREDIQTNDGSHDKAEHLQKDGTEHIRH